MVALAECGQEIEAIKEQIPIEAYLNNEFTYERFQETLQSSSVPIVHLATHGKFSSQLDNTFLQAYNDRISVNDLSQWLQSDRTEPLELLVLSACETATGDQRAALGLAGMAIRAGARSTVASLWQVDDVATSVFMTRFYEALSARAGNKAQALQIAQKHLD
jgi:CHAT domain-containing protein